MKFYNKVFISAILFFILSCKKFVDIPFPTAEVAKEDVFSSDATANAAQLVIFSQMGATAYSFSLSLLLGLSADEFENYSTFPVDVELYSNGLIPTNSNVAGIWTSSYNYIYQANAVLEGASKSNSLSPKVKNQLLGEAKFTRAFLYFYLINIFGDVPLLLTSNYKENSIASRENKPKVYEVIINDLKEAKNLLSTNYVGADGITTSTERLRPTAWAASALLSRVYLYSGDYASAETEATNVINQTSRFSILTDLNQTFLKNNKEAIWQISTTIDYNTSEGENFILSGPPYLVSLSTLLINSFEVNDKRRTEWTRDTAFNGVQYSYPFKYKVQSSTTVSEYVMALRFSEQYLIRAEARAQQNNITASQSDLNIIRNRAGLPNTAASDKTSLLNEIFHERQVELFTEWGHRWLDLKRTSRVDAVMSVVTPQKGGTWNTNMQLYPIPETERSLNPNLSQNLGY